MIKLTRKDIENILSIINKTDLRYFNELNETNFEEAVDVYAMYDYLESYDITGASKGVLFLNDYPDLVVKIPFNCGAPYTVSVSINNSSMNTSSYTYREVSDRFESAWQSLPKDLQNELNHDWDYCEVETILYDAAKEREVEEYFAETIYIGEVQGFPVYVQEKARIYNGESEYKWDFSLEEMQQYKEIKSKVKEYLAYEEWESLDLGMPTGWAIDFYLYYGLADLVELFLFLSNNCIDDLHSGNVGYINHVPVIIDYASFHS